MAAQSQESKETTHARIYTDKKDRIARITRVKAVKENRRVTEIDVLDLILERELPKEEKKLGI